MPAPAAGTPCEWPPLPLGGICALTLCLRPRGSANHFQGGPTVDVFGANGSNPTANWKVTGTVQKVYDKALKSHVFVCDGGPSAKMQLPKDDRRSLGLVQPYLALQIHVRRPTRSNPTHPPRTLTPARWRACVRAFTRAPVCWAWCRAGA